MTTTPETKNTETHHHFLTGIAQQGRCAHEFARAGRTQEAIEHLDAIDGLSTAYRMAVGEWEREAIHLHFSLSYANYLVLPRTLLQSMPDAFQARFVAMLDELQEAFGHVPQAEAYKVEAAVEREVSELSELERKMLGITADWYRGEEPPEGLSEQDLAEWRAEHENPDGPEYYDQNGHEMSGSDSVLVPVADPVPHYNRGRARVEPRLGGGE
jgi:hypothetical protein